MQDAFAHRDSPVDQYSNTVESLTRMALGSCFLFFSFFFLACVAGQAKPGEISILCWVRSRAAECDERQSSIPGGIFLFFFFSENFSSFPFPFLFLFPSWINSSIHLLFSTSKGGAKIFASISSAFSHAASRNCCLFPFIIPPLYPMPIFDIA